MSTEARGTAQEGFDAPLWKQPLDGRWQGMFVAGVRAHLAASRLAVPLLRKRRSDTGLIAFTTCWDLGRYLGNAYCDVAKVAVGRMAHALATNPEVLRHTGRTFRVGDLAREYGFTDVDGTQPPPFELPES